MAKRTKRKKRKLTHAGAVIWRKGKKGPQFLLLTPRRRYNQWLLPKGRIDPGEAPKKCARREVGEETGVDVEIGEKLGRDHFKYRRRGKRTNAVCVYYLAEAVGPVVKGRGLSKSELKKAANVAKAKKGRVAKAPENRKAVWVPIDDALELTSYAGMRRLLKKASKELAKSDD